MEVFVLAGMPGLGKSRIAEKLTRWLQEQGISATWRSVESEMQRLFAEGDPEAYGDGACQGDRLFNIICTEPQGRVKDVWRQAYRATLSALGEHDHRVAIVCACLVYYRSQTMEFYSPIDLESVQAPNGAGNAARPANILTLIDDVHDIYYRLTGPGEVFEVQPSIDRDREVYRLRQKPASDARERGLARRAYEIVFGHFLETLVWREKEVSAGAYLARDVGCGHAVLATKHPVESGVRLLLGQASDRLGLGNTYPVYVSHPISGPREEQRDSGQWPASVPHLTEVVQELAREEGNRCHVVPVMPTAIDEYRFAAEGDIVKPQLTERWPLLPGELMYSVPLRHGGDGAAFNSYEDFERHGLPSALRPPDGMISGVETVLQDETLVRELSGLLRTLKEYIRIQMAGRDHLLVGQCPGFFLYRPLDNRDHSFSKGVESEIRLFCTTRRYEAECDDQYLPRLMYFAHGSEDVTNFFAVPQRADVECPVRDVAANCLRELQTSTTSQRRTGERFAHTPNNTALSQVAACLLQQRPGDDQLTALLESMVLPDPAGSIGGASTSIPRVAALAALGRTFQCQKANMLSLTATEGEEPLCHSEGDFVEYRTKSKSELLSPDTGILIVNGLSGYDTLRRRAGGSARVFFCTALPST